MLQSVELYAAPGTQYLLSSVCTPAKAQAIDLWQSRQNATSAQICEHVCAQEGDTRAEAIPLQYDHGAPLLAQVGA